MPNLTKEGNYQVRVLSGMVRMEPTEEDPKAFRIVLKLETPDGFCAWYEAGWSKVVVKAGKSAGLTWAECTTNLLKSLGVEDGYPGNLQRAIDAGIQAEVVMKWDEYVDKGGGQHRVLRAKYLNPPKRTIDLPDVNWGEVLGVGGEASAKPAAPPNGVPHEEPGGDAADHIPF